MNKLKALNLIILYLISFSSITFTAEVCVLNRDILNRSPYKEHDYSFVIDLLKNIHVTCQEIEALNELLIASNYHVKPRRILDFVLSDEFNKNYGGLIGITRFIEVLNYLEIANVSNMHNILYVGIAIWLKEQPNDEERKEAVEFLMDMPWYEQVKKYYYFITKKNLSKLIDPSLPEVLEVDKKELSTWQEAAKIIPEFKPKKDILDQPIEIYQGLMRAFITFDRNKLNAILTKNVNPAALTARGQDAFTDSLIIYRNNLLKLRVKPSQDLIQKIALQKEMLKLMLENIPEEDREFHKNFLDLAAKEAGFTSGRGSPFSPTIIKENMPPLEQPKPKIETKKRVRFKEVN